MKTDRARLVDELDRLTVNHKDVTTRHQQLVEDHRLVSEELSSVKDVSQKLISQMQSTHESLLLTQESRFNALREEVDIKDRTIEALRVDNSQLLSKLQSQQVDQINGQAQSRQNEIEQLNLNMQHLQTEVDRLRPFETQTTELNQTLIRMAAEKEDLSTEINTLKHFQTKATESRQQMMEEMLSLRKNISDLALSKEELQTNINRSLTDLHERDAQLSDLKTQAEELQRDLDAANFRHSSAYLLLTQRQTIIDQLNSEAIQHQQAVENLKKQHQESMEDLQQRADQLNSRVKSLEEELANKTRADSITVDNAAIIEGLNTTVQTLMQEAAQAAAELQETKLLAESSRTDVDTFKALLEQADTKILELQKQIDQKDSDLSILNSQLTRSAEEKEQLKQTLEQKNTDLEQAQKRFIEADESIKEKVIELDDIRHRFGMKEAEVKENNDQLKRNKAMLKLMELKEEKQRTDHQSALEREVQKVIELTDSNERLIEQLNLSTAQIASLTTQLQTLEVDLKTAIESAQREKTLSDNHHRQLTATIDELREAQAKIQQQTAVDAQTIDRLKQEKQEAEDRANEHRLKIADLTIQLEEVTAAKNSLVAVKVKQEEHDVSAKLEIQTQTAAANQCLTVENQQLHHSLDSLTNKLQQKRHLATRLIAHLSHLQQSVHSLRSEVESSSLALRQLKEKTLFETPEFISLYTHQLEQKVARRVKLAPATPVQNPLLQMKEKMKDDILEELHQSLNFEQLLSKFEKLTSRNPSFSSNQLLIHNLNQNPNQPSGIRVDSELNPAPTTGSNEKHPTTAARDTTDKKKKSKLKSVSSTKRTASKRSHLGLLQDHGLDETGEEQHERDESASRTPNPDRQYLGKRKSSDIKKRLDADFADLKKKGTPKPIHEDGLRNLTNLTGGEIEPIILKSERKRPTDQSESLGRIVSEPTAAHRLDIAAASEEASRKRKSQ